MSGIEGPRAAVQVQVSEEQGAAARTKVLQEALDRQKVQKEELGIQLASGVTLQLQRVPRRPRRRRCWACKHC